MRRSSFFAMRTRGDRNGVQPDEAYGRAFTSQPFAQRRRQAGVSLPVASVFTPPFEPGTEQDHVSAGRNLCGYGFRADERVIARRHVHQNGTFADPERRRRLVERLGALEKMARRVEMGAEMVRQGPEAGVGAGAGPDLGRGLDTQTSRSAVCRRSRGKDVRQPERCAGRQRRGPASCSAMRCCISASAIFH